MHSESKKILERYVCSRHIQDEAIIRYINDNSIEVKCSYCDNDHAIPFYQLIRLLDQGFAIDYSDVYDGEAIWDSEKEEFDVEQWDVEGLLQDEMGIEVDGMLLTHLDEEYAGKDFCKKNPYGKKRHEELAYDWYYFSRLVKFSKRFTFFYPMTRENEYGYDEQYLPIAIFKDIGKAIHELNLYTLSKEPLFAYFSIFRARQHDEKEVITHYSNIGPAPKESAWANRFSPAEIPMFYGSEDESTAIEEVVNMDRKDRVITTGLFANQKPLNLIDLTALRPISPFDLQNNRYIYAVRFLRKFIEEISKPISKDGAEHIEYVPSQIITEYFRHVMPTEFGVEINGIKYYSTKCNRKICYVLFMDGDDVTQDDASNDPSKTICLRLSTLRTRTFEEVFK